MVAHKQLVGVNATNAQLPFQLPPRNDLGRPEIGRRQHSTAARVAPPARLATVVQCHSRDQPACKRDSGTNHSSFRSLGKDWERLRNLAALDRDIAFDQHSSY